MDVRTLLVIFLLFSGIIADAKEAATPLELSAVGGSCYDGDTCTVYTSSRILKVRLYGIDAPEYEQKQGPAAQAFTDALVRDKPLRMRCFGQSFERVVCTLFQAGRNINSEVVRQGWAFDFPLYSKGQYRLLEKNAHQRRLGVWADERRLISPYCYRHPQTKICHEDKLFMP